MEATEEISKIEQTKEIEEICTMSKNESEFLGISMLKEDNKSLNDI